MFHKCKYCDYQSPYRPNLRRHEKNKHDFQEPNSHQHVSNSHPYVHPYINNTNQQVNTYPQRTPEMQSPQNASSFLGSKSMIIQPSSIKRNAILILCDKKHLIL